MVIHSFFHSFIHSFTDHFPEDYVSGMAMRSAGIEAGLRSGAGRDEELRSDLVATVVDERDSPAAPVFDPRHLLRIHERSLDARGI